MGKFTLQLAAKSDLMDIFLYGIEQFGYAQSEQFQIDLNEQFQVIANFPLHNQSVDHINLGYRRCVYRSHSIYYRIEKDGEVTIIRILKRQDTTNAFTKIF